LISIVGYANIVSAFFPVICGLVFIRRLKPELKILMILFVVAAVEEVLMMHFALRRVNVNWVNHFYTPLEYAIFTYVFALWQDQQRVKRVFLWSIPVFAIFCLWDILDRQNLQYTNNFTAAVACALYLIATSYTLVRIERERIELFYKDYRFWILGGLLVYAAGSLPYFVFFRQFHSYYLWGFHGGLNVLTNIFYAVGVVCQIRSE
jgi:hypothetical protein